MKFQSGLSLLELLLSLSLIALISALTYPSLSTVIKSWQSSTFATTASDEYAAQRFMRLQLGQAMPVRERERSTRSRLVAFAGDKMRVAFISPLHNVATVKYGLFNSIFELSDDKLSNSQTLKFFYRTYDRGLTRESFENPGVAVISGIHEASFEYFSASSKRWSDSWHDNKALPAAVRFKFINAKGQAQIWTMRLMLSEPLLVTYSSELNAS